MDKQDIADYVGQSPASKATDIAIDYSIIKASTEVKTASSDLPYSDDDGQRFAGTYSYYSAVAYYSVTNGGWINARVVAVCDGRVVLDLKPRQVISVEEQRLKVRPREEDGAHTGRPSKDQHGLQQDVHSRQTIMVTSVVDEPSPSPVKSEAEKLEQEQADSIIARLAAQEALREQDILDMNLQELSENGMKDLQALNSERRQDWAFCRPACCQ